MKSEDRRKAGVKYFRDLVTELWASEEGRWFRNGLMNLNRDGETLDVGRAMDLGYVLGQLESGMYEKGADFDYETIMADIRKTFENCMRYNECETEAHKCAQKLLDRVEGEFKRWAEFVEIDNFDGIGGMKMVFTNTEGMVKKKRAGDRNRGLMKQLEREHTILSGQRDVLHKAEVEMKWRKSRRLSVFERRELYERLKLLHDCEGDAFLMFGVVGILARGMKCPGLRRQKVVNVCLDKMPDEILREMEYFLDNPTLVRAIDTLDDVEKRMIEIEIEYVRLVYKKNKAH